MMITRLRLKEFKFNRERFSKTFEEMVNVQLRQAARAFLRAILAAGDDGLPPVFTGTARGSLKPLGQFLRVAVPINPIAIRKNRGPEVGAAQSHYSFYRRGYVFGFTWSTDVRHYIINEFTDPRPVIHLTHDAPWFSQQIGIAAFEVYMRANLMKRIPKIKDFVTSKSIDIG